MLTLHGGGNALLVHLGTMHRLYELGYLKGVALCSSEEFAFARDEQNIFDDWNSIAKSNTENVKDLLDGFGFSIRALRRQRRWLKLWMSSEACGSQIEEFWAKLSLSPNAEVRWGVKDGAEAGGCYSISEKRHMEMKQLALSPECLPERGHDYLIDWGYVLCDVRLSSIKGGISPEQTAFVSPNRLFYRSFERMRESFARPYSSEEQIDGKTTAEQERPDEKAA